MYRSFKNIPRKYIFIMAFLLCTATIVTCLTKPIVPNDESITDLATLFPEYTEVTGVSALHSLDVWCQADSAQLEDFLALLELWFSMEPETVHFTEASPSKRAGDTSYRIELGEKRCEMHIKQSNGDILLFDFGNGDLRAYRTNRNSELYTEWASADETHDFDYLFHRLCQTISSSVDTTIQLKERYGKNEYTYPTKLAGGMARDSICEAIARNWIYQGDAQPDYNLEIITDNQVYICDDELDVFYIKHKEDQVYQASGFHALNHDKYERQKVDTRDLLVQ